MAAKLFRGKTIAGLSLTNREGNETNQRKPMKPELWAASADRGPSCRMSQLPARPPHKKRNCEDRKTTTRTFQQLSTVHLYQEL
ncbi:hypothetical protein MRB53_008935 [Persea americana]|uniref:Uncharacterized protein n=1 Tax=Persea americana TaxID=3435 RepID=A0ACC2LN77_PERAE|nr:hypothetical protein MRB53_008935 [Persea americana]